MTTQEAMAACNTMSDCLGFTFVPLQMAQAVPIYMKASDEWVSHEAHLTYIKRRPSCSNLKYMTYGQGQSGPYCCEGSGCPDEQAYAATELTCSFPAATPYGTPPCASLRGEPLLNLALQAEASALSQWGFLENAGVNAVKVGVQVALLQPITP